MRKTFIAVITFLFLLSFNSFAKGKSEDLNPAKMKKVTTEILELFVSGKSAELKQYISEDWLDSKRLDIKKYKINNYSPEQYEVLFASGDICIATFGGKEWKHLAAFKFTEEYGLYKVVPRGISESSSDYIDPWFYVKDYVCSKDN
jgi:hypothetical protein